MNGNFKARCIDTKGNSCVLAKGKIYEFVNGVSNYDNGMFLPSKDKYKDFDDLTHRGIGIWELVEDSKLDRFAKGEIVLQTPTKDIYDMLMEWCDEKGIKWCSGDKASKKNWWFVNSNGSSIANNFDGDNGMCYASSEYLRNKGCKVETLSMDDFGAPTPIIKEKKLPTHMEDACIDGSASKSIVIDFVGNRTIASLVVGGRMIKQESVNLCIGDKYSMAKGSEEAIKKLFAKKAKVVKVKESEEATEVVEVKRKAKVGEWVKIVHLDAMSAGYCISDIFKVLDGGLGVTGIIDSEGEENILFHNEYVVLENYKPEVK